MCVWRIYEYPLILEKKKAENNKVGQVVGVLRSGEDLRQGVAEWEAGQASGSLRCSSFVEAKPLFTAWKIVVFCPVSFFHCSEDK